MKKYFMAMLLIACFSMVGCADYDDFEFEGTVVGYRFCTTLSMSDVQGVGYYVQLDSPDSVGGTVSIDGASMDNVIVVYRADRVLRSDDHIHGRIYLDDKYSRANCTVHPTGAEKDLPEAVFTKIVVD